MESLTEDEETAIRESAERIMRFHEKQLPEEWKEVFPEGFEAGEIVRPLESVGCYVSGGNFPLASTALITVIPADIAGVDRKVVAAPPDDEGKVNPYTVAAAEIAGADEIYSVGGSQAIAAMAYGTESIPEVDKIVGSGNDYVVATKKLAMVM